MKKIYHPRIVPSYNMHGKAGCYNLDGDVFCNKKAHGLSGISSTYVSNQIMQWHLRLGHPSFLYLKYLFPTLFKGVDPSMFQCESCHLFKDHRVKFLPKPYCPSKPFYLIHSDVWGPSKVSTLSGKKWFVIFIDDHTWVCWIYLLAKKSDVPRTFKDFFHMIEA